MIITAGSTNVSLYVYFVDDDGGTAPGEPTTAKLFSDIETGGSASYVRQGAARTDFTLITLASASAAHADGGFILVDDTNMPGVYRVDVPDAAFATGADFVIIQMVMASANNSIMRPLLVDLTDVDLRDSVRGGMTALPNAAADAAGGLAISDAGGLDLDAKLAATNEVTAVRMAALTDWINGGRLDLILDIIAADVVNIDGLVPLSSTVSGRTLDVSLLGYAGLDYNNTQGTIDDTQIATGAITAAKFAAGAIDAAALATDAVNEIRDAILPTQNAALSNIEFLFVHSTDHVTPVTGATGTAVTRSIDGGAFSSGTGTLAEVANGIYQYDASAADMNGGIITFRFVATGGTPGAPDDRFLTIVTGGGV